MTGFFYVHERGVLVFGFLSSFEAVSFNGRVI
jgi:hypothetical protein